MSVTFCYPVPAGGAHFEASFGPGRYRAFTCVDFKGEGYELVSAIPAATFASTV